MFLAIIVIASLILIFSAYLVWENSTFGTTTYTIEDDRLSGLKIVLVSDLHNAAFGVDNEKLAKQVAELDPDYVFFTGDTFDNNGQNNSFALIERLSDYRRIFVSGNHEANLPLPEYEEIKAKLKDSGVIILEDSYYIAECGGKQFTVLGLDDPNVYSLSDQESALEKRARSLTEPPTRPVLVLAHRPEYMPTYASLGYDYVFSGHAHGGQWRLFGRGVYTKSQGLFPKYTQGIYKDTRTTMIVSRGLGTSAPVPRIFNRPEIVVVEYVAEKR